MSSVADVVDALVAKLPRAIVPLSELEIGEDALRAAVESGAVELWVSLSSCVLAQSEAAKRGLQLHAPHQNGAGDVGAWQWCVRPPRERSKLMRLDDYSDPPAPEAALVEESEALEWIEQHQAELVQPRRQQPRANDWQGERDRRDKSRLLPRHVLETSPWSPAIEAPNGKPCACCGGQALGLLTVCLGCLASGLDPWLERPKPLPRHAYRPHEVLKGGTGT